MDTSVTERGLTSPRLLSLLAVIGAIAVTCAAWAVAHLLAGITLEVRLTPGAQPEPVGIASVTVASALAGVVALLVVAVLRRRTKRPRRNWLVISLVLLAVSLAGPLSGAQTASALVSLVCLHLLAAAVLIPVLWRSLPDRPAFPRP